MFPPKVIQRLRLGRPVAAEIPAALPEHRAWIHVQPIVDPRLGQMRRREPGLEPTLISYGGESPIVGLRVRHREIHRRFEARPDDRDLAGLSVDDVHVAKSEEDLAALGALTLPHNVGDPF